MIYPDLVETFKPQKEPLMSTKYGLNFKQKTINLALSRDQIYRQTADDLDIK